MNSHRTSQHDFDLNSLFASIKLEKCAVVAVSGGSDSIALLYMLHQWSNSLDTLELVVVTVDHGLRAESTGEAESVAEFCKSLGLSHVIKCWQGEKPKSAVSRLAREARYSLLSEAAREVDATAIILGHTLNDQHETIMMRAGRLEFSDFGADVDDSTPRGLAGIRPQGIYCGPPDFQPVRLLRPLLTVAREELRDMLRRNGITWFDDPGNEDPKYERARMRSDLAGDNSSEALRIAHFGDRVAAKRQGLDAKCAEFILSHVMMDNSCVIQFEQEKLNASSGAISELVLRVLVAIAGGRNYFVPQKVAAELTAQISSDAVGKYTVGSAIIEWRKNRVRLWREYRNLPGVPVLRTQEISLSYDGRIVLRFEKDQLEQKLDVDALGREGLAQIERQLGRKIAGQPRAALWSQPALWRQGEVVALPVLGWAADGFKNPRWQLWSPALELFQLDCDQKVLNAVKKIRPSDG